MELLSNISNHSNIIQIYKVFWKKKIMTHILSICLSFSVLVFSANADLVPRKYPTNYDYMVSIMQYDSNDSICGGAIIGPQTILTAARCIDGKEISSLKVFSGSSLLYSNDATKSQISKIAKDDMNEIAILTLADPLDLTWCCRRAINLPSKDHSPGTAVSCAGWGSPNIDPQNRSGILLKMEVELADVSQCQKFKFPLSQQYHVCTLPGPENKGICDGDYGSPLVAFDEIVGVAAFTDVCGRSPSVYYNVYAHLEFIRTQTGIEPRN